MSEQTQPVDERYCRSERLKLLSGLAAQRGDAEAAIELGCAAEAALLVESLQRIEQREAMMAGPPGYGRERER